MSDQAFIRRLFEWQKRINMDKRHRYTVYTPEGQALASFPSVTTIIGKGEKPMLTQWRMKVQREADIVTARRLADLCTDGYKPDENFASFFMELAGQEYEAQKIARETADTGKKLHGLIEHWIGSHLEGSVFAPREDDPKARALFALWLQWAQAEDFDPLFTEMRVFSRLHGYGGTIDCGGYIRQRTKVAIYDWKTSSGVWPDHYLQSVAYQAAAIEMGEGDPSRMEGYVVVVPRDESGVYMKALEMDRATVMQGFLGLKAFYDFGRDYDRFRKEG